MISNFVSGVQIRQFGQDIIERAFSPPVLMNVFQIKVLFFHIFRITAMLILTAVSM